MTQSITKTVLTINNAVFNSQQFLSQIFAVKLTKKQKIRYKKNYIEFTILRKTILYSLYIDCL